MSGFALISNSKVARRFGHGLAAAFGFSLQAQDAKEARMTKLICSLLLGTALMAGPALAQVPLNKDQHITDSLVAGKVGDTIRSTCPSISAKMFTVLAALNDLKAYAVAKGYTEEEVKAFLKNKTEKARINALAAAHLKTAGAVEGDAESYCKVGRDEIAKGTLTGSLLRSWK